MIDHQVLCPGLVPRRPPLPLTLSLSVSHSPAPVPVPCGTPVVHAGGAGRARGGVVLPPSSPQPTQTDCNWEAQLLLQLRSVQSQSQRATSFPPQTVYRPVCRLSHYQVRAVATWAPPGKEHLTNGMRSQPCAGKVEQHSPLSCGLFFFSG